VTPAALSLLLGLVFGEAWLRGTGHWLPGALAGALAGVSLLCDVLGHLRGPRPQGSAGVARLERAGGFLLLAMLAAAGLSRGSDSACRWERGESLLTTVAGEAWVEVRFPALPERYGVVELRAVRPARIGGRLLHLRPPLRLILQGSLPAADSLAVLRSPDLVWQGFAWLEPGRPPRGPGGWDERTYLRCRGTVGYLRSARLQPGPAVTDAPRRPRSGVSIAAALGGLRDRMARTIRGRLGGDEGLLATSFLLGTRSAGPEARQRLGAFSRAGVAHLLAVSGLHVALIGAGAALLLGVLPIGWRVRALGLGLAIVAYASLVGWSESVTRAAATGALWAALRALGRRPDARVLLLVVLVAVLLRRPAAWRDPGLRLSYLVTLAILGASHIRAPRRVRWGLACVAAQSAAWPLVLSHLGSGSPLFLAANAVLVPLSGLVPPFVLIGIAASALPGFPAEVALAPTSLFLRGFLGLVRGVASACDAWPVGSTLGTDAALVASVAVAIGWNLPGRRARARLTTACVLCVAATMIGRPSGRTPALLMLDVGQGESWLMVWKKETWLIDTGPTPGHGDRPSAVIAPALRSYGRRGVTRLFLTHDDEDHSGGLEELITQNVRVGTIHPPVGWHPGERTRAFLARAAASGAQIRPLSRGDTLHAAEANVVIENPDLRTAEDGDNQGCLVLRIETPGLTLLVTGDAPSEVLERCARPAPAGVVLSAGHHGSASSTPERLLGVMRPTVVLVSVGRENRFGHPSPLVLERVAGAGAVLRRTDRDGTIMIALQGKVWRVRAGSS